MSSAGYATGVVALHPADWRAVLAMKDDANRYQFGGSRSPDPSARCGRCPSCSALRSPPARPSLVTSVGPCVPLSVSRSSAGLGLVAKNGVGRNGDPADGAKEPYTRRIACRLAASATKGSNGDEHRPLSCH